MFPCPNRALIFSTFSISQAQSEVGPGFFHRHAFGCLTPEISGYRGNPNWVSCTRVYLSGSDKLFHRHRTDSMASRLPSLSQEMEQLLFHDNESDEDDELEIEELRDSDRDAEYIMQPEDESSDSDYSEDGAARSSRPKQAKRGRGRMGEGGVPLAALVPPTHQPSLPPMLLLFPMLGSLPLLPPLLLALLMILLTLTTLELPPLQHRWCCYSCFSQETTTYQSR